jgi:hypothetical protein
MNMLIGQPVMGITFIVIRLSSARLRFSPHEVHG